MDKEIEAKTVIERFKNIQLEKEENEKLTKRIQEQREKHDRIYKRDHREEWLKHKMEKTILERKYEEESRKKQQDLIKMAEITKEIKKADKRLAMDHNRWFLQMTSDINEFYE